MTYQQQQPPVQGSFVQPQQGFPPVAYQQQPQPPVAYQQQQYIPTPEQQEIQRLGYELNLLKQEMNLLKQANQVQTYTTNVPTDWTVKKQGNVVFLNKLHGKGTDNLKWVHEFTLPAEYAPAVSVHVLAYSWHTNKEWSDASVEPDGKVYTRSNVSTDHHHISLCYITN